MLLKSCATPPASLPIASIFCDSASRRSRSRCSSCICRSRRAISQPASGTRDQQHRGQRQLRHRRSLDLAGDQGIAAPTMRPARFRRRPRASPTHAAAGRPASSRIVVPCRSAWSCASAGVGATPSRPGPIRTPNSGVASPTTRRAVGQVVHRRPEIDLDEAVDVDDEREHAVEVVGGLSGSRRWARCATPA